MLWLLALPFKFLRIIAFLMVIKPYTFFYRAMSPNVGLRIVRGWLLIGLPLTILSFGVLTYLFYIDDFFSKPLQLIYVIAFFFFVVKPLRKVTRKGFKLSWVSLSLLRWLNIGAILFFIWQVLPQVGLKYAFQLYIIENVQIPSFISEAYNQTLGQAFDYLNIQLFSTQVADIDRFLLFTTLSFILGFIFCYGIPVISFVIEIFKENGIYRKWYVSSHASRFAGPGTYLKYPYRFGWGRKTKRVYLGRTRFEDFGIQRDVFLKDDSHLLVVGASGSGKSLTSIWPMLATYSGSVLVMDPKGEHANAFVKRRQELNNKVYVLDPFGITSTRTALSRYNPLSEIDLSKPEGRKRLTAVTSSMIIKTNGQNRYWEESGLVLLDGFIAYTLLVLPKKFHNLPAIVRMLLGKDPERKWADPENLQKLVVEMLTCDNDLVQIAATLLTSLEGREYGIIMSELMNAVKWVTDPAIAQHISHSDFEFSEYRKTTMSVFVCASFGSMVEHDRWLRILTNLSMRIMEDNKKKIHPALNFILDEMPQYGQELKQLKHDIVALRSAGVRLCVYVQNYGQLEDCFGRAAVADFESSSTVQVYGVRDNHTAKWVSEKLGQTEQQSSFLSKKEDTRGIVPLMDAAKVQTTLQKTKPLQIVFPPDGFPMLLERMAYKSVKVEGQSFRGLKLHGLLNETKH